jgi:ADP-heptose:LPS heptosyltransferase
MKRIFITGENLLGDYLMQTPAIRGLHAKYPDRELVYCTPDNVGSRPLIVNNPYISRVWTKAQGQVMASKGDIWMPPAEAGQMFAIGQQQNCTMAEALCRMWKVPFDDGHYDLTPSPTSLLTLVTDDQDYVVCGRHSRSCTSNDPKIGVPNKCIPNRVWVDIANWLLAHDITPLAVGAPDDEHDPLYAEWPGRKLYGEPLLDIALLQKHALFTVSVDTGIRHMAAAVGGNLLTLNHAIPLSLIRCVPKSPSQMILEPTVDIYNIQLQDIIPQLEQLTAHARRSNTPS